MAHLDVYRNPDRRTAAVIPFVLDVQSSLLGELPASVVIPLAYADSLETLPMLRLNPQISIEGAALVALTQDLAPVPRRMLKQPVTNLSPQRDEILAALDFLFTGF
ncbi:MAG: CcdB family protein [Rhodocyclaceae bacterium]|nr:CcdB family protein [Rhodocyclaceae bacterium]